MGIAGDDFSESFFRLVIFLLALVDRAAHEGDVIFFVGLGKFVGLVESGFRFGPVAEPRLHLRKRDINVAVLGRALHQRLQLRNRGVALTKIGLLRGQHHLQLLVIGKFFDAGAGHVAGLLPQLGVAIGLDHLLIAARRVLVAHVEHLLEDRDGRIGLVLLAQNSSQSLQENRAVVLVAAGVFEIRFFGLLQQSLQDLRGFVVAALRFIDQRGVVGDLERIGD